MAADDKDLKDLEKLYDDARKDLEAALKTAQLGAELLQAPAAGGDAEKRRGEYKDKAAKLQDKLKKVQDNFDKIHEKCKPAAPSGTDQMLNRFGSGIADVDVDKGQQPFWEMASAEAPLTESVGSALSHDADKWRVCKACWGGIVKENEEVHFNTRCLVINKDEESKKQWKDKKVFQSMTGIWAVDEARKSLKKIDPKIPEDRDDPRLYLCLYTLNSPLCYSVGRSMRNFFFWGEKDAFQPFKNFAYSLHRAIVSEPKYAGTVFRAMDFKVPESLYTPGAVVTMPQATSASMDPNAVKAFLGKKAEGAAGPTGTILIMRCVSGRVIEKYSSYPEEREVLIATNTQFRSLGSPDDGVRKLLQSALGTDISNITVVELKEIEFLCWGDLPDLLTPEERARNQKLLKGIKELRKEWKAEGKTRNARCKVTMEQKEVYTPLSTTMPEDRGSQKTLLQLAAQVPENQEVVSLMVAKLSYERMPEVFDDALSTALGMNKDRTHEGTIAILLSKGADVSTLKKRNRKLTPDLALLACACKWPIIEKVKAVMEKAAVVEFWNPGYEGKTVLHAAALRNRKDLLDRDHLISDKLKLDVVDDFQRTPLFVAAESGSEGALDALIKAGADFNKTEEEGCSPCYTAARHGHYLCVKRLMEAKADPNAHSKKRRTPSWVAASFGHTDIIKLLADPKAAGVKADCGKANMNLADTNGLTPLMAAAANGHADTLTAIIKQGKADLDIADNAGETALWKAAQNGGTYIIRLLIQLGANPDKPDKKGHTPCHTAVLRGHVDALRVLVVEGNAALGDAPAAVKSSKLVGPKRGDLRKVLRKTKKEGVVWPADFNKPQEDEQVEFAEDEMEYAKEKRRRGSADSSDSGPICAGPPKKQTGRAKQMDRSDSSSSGPICAGPPKKQTGRAKQMVDSDDSSDSGPVGHNSRPPRRMDDSDSSDGMVGGRPPA